MLGGYREVRSRVTYYNYSLRSNSSKYSRPQLARLRHRCAFRFPDASDTNHSLSSPNTKNSRRSFLYLGGYRGNLSLHERYRLSIFIFVNSKNIRQPFRFALRLFCFAIAAQKTLCPVAAPTQKSPRRGFCFGAATGNRTRISGTTNRRNDRYTIAAI